MEILGVFRDMESAAAGAEALVQGGFYERDITSLSSGPYPRGVLVQESGRSFFRWISLAGGVIGAALGFLLAAGTAWLYPLHTGDKPIISLFPVGIITYEFAMLCAILGTIAGMFLEMRLPAFKERIHDPAISKGWIGISVQCAERDQQARAEKILKDAGAVRVRTGNET